MRRINQPSFVEQPLQRGFRAAQASKYCGFSESQLWELVKEGRIAKGRKISARCTIWLKEDLDAFLEGLESA